MFRLRETINTEVGARVDVFLARLCRRLGDHGDANPRAMANQPCNEACVLPRPLDLADHDAHVGALEACPRVLQRGHDLCPSVLDEKLAVCNTPQRLALKHLTQG